MNGMQKFLICKHCGNLVGFVHDSGVPLVCCGEEMALLEPNTVDASVEKHLPVVKFEGSIVEAAIGGAPHPMTPEHFIQWVYLQTDKGGQRKTLGPGEAPVVRFAVSGDKPRSVYAYCNLHGLWVTEV